MESSERGKFAREDAKDPREKRRQYCDYDTNRATPPPRGQWQCQGRNGTGSVTAFARDDSAVSAVVASPSSSSSSSSYASAVEAIHPNVVTVDDRQRRGRRENCRRDRIYVTRRAFGADCTRSAYSLSRVPRAIIHISLARSRFRRRWRVREIREIHFGGIILRMIARGHVVEEIPDDPADISPALRYHDNTTRVFRVAQSPRVTVTACL